MTRCHNVAWFACALVSLNIHGRPLLADALVVHSQAVDRCTDGVDCAVTQHPAELAHVTAEASAYGSCLLGSVAVVMVLFYLVNWPDDDIVANTWQTLSVTVSIFSAVLMYGTMQGAIVQWLGAHTQRSETFILLGMFAFSFVSLQAILLVLLRVMEADEDDSPFTDTASKANSIHSHAGRNWLRAISTILSHITGFAAMYCAAGMQALPLFSSSLAATIALVGVVGLALAGLCGIGGYIRREVALADDGEISEAEEIWMELVEDAENDVYSLCLGFSIMQVIRFAIMGTPQPYLAEHQPHGVSQSEANFLLLATSLLCLATAGGTKFVNHIGSEHVRTRRAFRTANNIASVAMAWCFLFWGEWQMYVLGFEGVRVAGLLCVALSLTAFSFAVIVILDLIADASEHHEARVLRTLILSLGLMIGFTWERAFHMGLEALSYHHSGHRDAWTRYTLAIVLVVVVVPAWAKYILPHALVAREHNMTMVASGPPESDGTRSLPLLSASWSPIGSRRC